MRLVRFLLPAYLVREIDELVQGGHGGYETREEFIRDAIQNHVLEVKHVPLDGRDLIVMNERTASSSSPSQPRGGSMKGSDKSAESSPSPARTDDAETRAEPPVQDMSETRISKAGRGPAVVDGLAQVRQEPMLGLHNRDYPSIWAAHMLAVATSHGPITVQEFFEAAVRDAWSYGQRLLPLEEATKVKLTALFPTNAAKAQASEEGFRTFAIGDIARRPNGDGTINASGPLFLWGVCDLTRTNGRVLIGLTPQGYDLLEALDGLTLEFPHSKEQAERFFDFLRAKAPSDWSGFATLLDAAIERPTREELSQRFQSWHPEWGASKANTNAAGYVARAREWGLLEPKLLDRRYVLTEFGDALRAEAA